MQTREAVTADGRRFWYLLTMPRAIPAGRVLVHNNVRPTRRLGLNGFRAWLAEPDAERYAPCECGWAAELGRHFIRADR